MPGDWQLYALALALTVVLYVFLSWLLGKNPHPVCVFCDGSGLYPGERVVLGQPRRRCPLCVGTGVRSDVSESTHPAGA
jgi:hypothetical protein